MTKNIAAANYYKKVLPTNQITDTNLQKELHIYSTPLNVLTTSN
jgi:hypothetical protein